MKGRVKIELHQAANFAMQGFEVECFIVAPEKDNQPDLFKQRKKRKIIDKNSWLMLSFEGEEPQHGDLAIVWRHIKDNLFKSPLSKIRYSALIDFLKKEGTHSSYSSQLVNRYKCLRIVE